MLPQRATDAQPALSTVDDWRRRNLVTVALLIARAALRREESRGGHFRQDFPARDDDSGGFTSSKLVRAWSESQASTQRSTQSRRDRRDQIN